METKVTADSPAEETAREFARWLSGGVAGDMVTGWEDYWTTAIERREAVARAAGRAELEGALGEIAKLHQYDNGIHRFPSGGREPCAGCIAHDALATQRAEPTPTEEARDA